MKKTVSILLGLLTALSFSACQAEPAESGRSAPPSSAESPAGDSNVNKTGLPIVNDPIELNAMVSLNVNTPDWNTHPALAHMEEITNIKVNYDCIPDAGFVEKRNLAFASNELPDFMIRTFLTAEQETKYAAAKQIIPLESYFKDYAPNFSALMSQDPSISKNITAPDGHVYGMPMLNSIEDVFKSWINKTWLDNLNLDMPETLEEFRDVLRAFKNEDPNGNGKQDEIPYSGHHMDACSILSFYFGSYGLANNYGIIGGGYGFAQNNAIVDGYCDIDDSGKVRMLPLLDEYRDILAFLNSLWEEGLMDKEIFSQKMLQTAAKVNNDTVGFVASSSNTQWMGDAKTNYLQPPAFKGPDGKSGWCNVNSNVAVTNTFIITPKNQYPEATMRWVDYFYSKEGTILVRLGIEGKSYQVVDGKYELLPEIKNDPNGLSLDAAAGKWALYTGGNMPQYITNEVDQSAAQLPQTKAATDTLRPDLVPASNIPRLKYTEEETIKMSQYAQDIKTFINENSIKFITGERPISEYDDFRDKLQKMNIKEYMAILQASFDRWNSN